jgi:hypothetical protein
MEAIDPSGGDAEREKRCKICVTLRGCEEIDLSDIAATPHPDPLPEGEGERSA